MLAYEVLETLSASPALRVSRCRRGDRKAVILKRLAADAGPKAHRRLRHEYELLRRIDLPAVIKAFALTEADSGLEMELEDIGGQSLEGVLASGEKLSLSQFLDLAAGLVETLAGLHRQGIVHKDINPAHIVMNVTGGQFRLIGFGNADELFQSQVGLKPPSAIEGNLAYIAPEQTGRMNRQVDYRCDIYSLGATFYRLLAGRPPFEAEDVLGLVHQHIAVMPPPPHVLNSMIPAALSRIVMKMLAKMAEDRYQSGAGLAADLLRCRHDLAAGLIPNFEPGQEDFSDRLQIPQKLYGRQAAIDRLLAAFERAGKGGRELLLVAGYAGVGKTALVHETHRLIAAKHRHFIEGKFDQLQRNVPYFGWIQAFSSFVRYLLMESEAQLSHWRRIFTAAVGNIGRVLTDIIPNFELVIGRQPEVPALDAAEGQNRFNYAFMELVKAVATPEHPLVIFLDDLQWIDSASLGLLQTLLTRTGIANLLLIGAFRDNEVDALHPLTTGIEALHKEKAAVATMTIGELTQKTVNELIADSLLCDPERTVPLTRLIFARTGGNPFFLHQTVKALTGKQILTFDYESRCWRWDISAIEKMGISDNVVSLMLERIRQLVPEMQQLLSLAACIGFRFGLSDLSTVAGWSQETTFAGLQHFLRDGLIITGQEQYQFVHDRVQEAAYATIPADERPAQHLRIGRLLLARTPQDAWTENIFEIVGHLNQATALINAPEEREQLAQLNLIAGRRAKTAAAFPLATSYFATGTAQAGPSAWETNYDLVSALLLEQAESEYLIGNFEHSDALIEEALDKVATLPDQAWAYRLRIRLYQLSGRFHEAASVALNALRGFGFSFPETDEAITAATDAQIRSVAAHLRGRRIADLAEIPLSDNVEARALIGLLEEAMPLIYAVRPLLWVLINTQGTNLCLQQGHAAESPFIYSGYALILVACVGDIPSAIQFSEMAIKLNERFPSAAAWRGKLLFHHGALINIWGNHFGENLPLLDKAFQACLNAGDLAHAGYLTYNAIWLHLENGDPLTQVARIAHDYAQFARQNRNTIVYNVDCMEEQFALCLMGKTRSDTDFSDDAFDEATCLADIEQSGFSLGIAYHHIMKLVAAFLVAKYDEALVWANRVAPMLLQVAAMANTATFHLYHGLTLAALHQKAPVHQQAEFRHLLEDILGKMKCWATHCPENFANRQALIEAEIARIDMRDPDAMGLYEQAIASAHENGFVHNEAVAWEVAAAFYRQRGYEKIARTYLAEAAACYSRWGAAGKVRQLGCVHPWLSPTRSPQAATLAEHLDALSVAKAQRAISGEIHLDRLAQTLVRIAMENVAAQKGFLSVEGAGQLQAEVHPDAAGGQRINFDPSPLVANIPEAIINYVRRSRDTVILADARKEAGEFAADDYLQRIKPRSVLCMAIQRMEKLLAVLYLENNLVAGAFTPERCFVLEVLAAQAAISLETSAVYEALRRLNADLDQRVLDRTAQLEAANKELDAFAHSVSHDLRAPLRHIAGFLELLEKISEKALDDQSRHYMNAISGAAKKMGLLINDLLSFSRMGRKEMSFKQVDLGNLVRGVIQELAPDAAGRNIAWRIGDLPAVFGDSAMLRMVLANLIANALKFTRPRQQARIEIGSIPGQGSETVIFVRDNGVGFDMNYVAKLFGVFQRLHHADEFEGTGIGLANVRRIIARHGGRTWAQGQLDGGAAFFFSLPQMQQGGGHAQP